jgi:glycine hydroxymethyltransferase
MKRGVKSVQHSIFPLTTSNTHLARLPAMGITALEMKVFGVELAKQTVKNARVAGECLFENGVKVLGEKNGFTKSHQIAVDVREYGGGKKVAENLEEANIIVNKNLLPYDDQKDKENPSGLRIGFQDVTRRGFKESDIKHLCNLMVTVIKGKKPSRKVREDTMALRQNFKEIKYGFQNIDEIVKYAKRHG